MSDDVCPATGGEHDWVATGTARIIVDGKGFRANCNNCDWTFRHPDIQACRIQAKTHLDEEHN